MKGRQLLFSLILIIVSVNPFTEKLEFSSPVIYMLSHYALVSSGFILGHAILKTKWYFMPVGLTPIAFWHLPLPFALGATYIGLRIVLEITIFLGGFLAGSSIWALPQWGKISLFILYMIGDTALSILFIVESPLYSNRLYPFSPYPPSSLPLAGIAMIVVMNLILATVIYVMFKNLLRGL
ncbi:DUF1404 domain-containing protein [Metallosphaera hakonensis]|uniref:DUF1404 domain-containing protein n=1 Tax=Metallosphaera hakonensis JCM 8857 = DSM 7519 TaxID=1293036 RepID=A0A2U9IST1_9CREN|nr:DUF1404 domain-containing protein [Metallosphaera hakonensis]AWR99110.1 DUF1404 domain-containing protein [Metallosphaera hakonensis JCM 8857 = DSM 7519]